MKAKMFQIGRLQSVVACSLVGFVTCQAQVVDLQLALVVDVSGSVDDSEYALQMDGYAAAFENPLLHSAISGGATGQIAVNLIQFSSSAAESIPWTVISNSATSTAFAAEIRAAARLFSGGTNIDSGIELATTLITTNTFSGRSVIDVSGDGSGASGAARDAALAAGINTINGIVISDSGGFLLDHFTNFVISPDGFVEEAVTFEDFEPSVLRKLQREITGQIGDSGRIISASLHTSSITLGRTMTRDVGGRLFRMRTGVRPEGTTVTQPPPPMDSKGGMAKGAVEPITTTYVPQWEVWGQIFYSNDNQDARYQSIQAGAARRLLQAKTDTEIFGGTVGAEYRFGGSYTAGLALSAAEADVTMRNVGTADVDSIALIPYFSYYRPDVFPGGDFYADALYAYSWNDYDSSRDPGFKGSTDGNSHQIELNAGLNLRGGPVVHGPYAQFRWLDGEVDGYRDSGGLIYTDSDYESVATQLGYQVSYPIAIQGGTVVPQARVAWEHEFEADQGSVGGIPLGEVDEDLAVLGAGVGVFFRNGWNGILDYEARLGGDNENHYVGLKVGKEF